MKTDWKAIVGSALLIGACLFWGSLIVLGSRSSSEASRSQLAECANKNGPSNCAIDDSALLNKGVQPKSCSEVHQSFRLKSQSVPNVLSDKLDALP